MFFSSHLLVLSRKLILLLLINLYYNEMPLLFETGLIPPETSALMAKNHTKEAVLLTELKASIDCDGKVSFGEFLEAFRVHEDPGNAEEINMLAEEFKILKSAE